MTGLQFQRTFPYGMFPFSLLRPTATYGGNYNVELLVQYSDFQGTFEYILFNLCLSNDTISIVLSYIIFPDISFKRPVKREYNNLWKICFYSFLSYFTS